MESPESPAKPKPAVTLLASSAKLRGPGASPDEADSFFKSAEWSADGTTIIASLSSNEIHSYVLPEDLLGPRQDMHQLAPQGILALPEPTHAMAAAPYFSLAAPYTQTVLVACRDHPIQLFYALPEASSEPQSLSAFPTATTRASQRSLVSSYRLMQPETEAYLTPMAMLWPSPGTHFLTGSSNLLAYFDVTRTGEGPVHRIPTIPSRRHISKGNGIGMRGTVSALSCQLPADVGGGSLVAAGTWTRWVGLYDLARSDQRVVTWSVAGAAAETEQAQPTPGSGADADDGGGAGGQGILQTIWSPCGRYLLINERKSAGVLVYDIRVAGRLLGWLSGRPARTNQRLSCDVYPGAAGKEDAGFEVWAGTDDGTAVVWEGVGTLEGRIAPSWDWQAHESAVGSAAMHPSGSVVATCCGSWAIPDEDDGTSGPLKMAGDASLSIWGIGAPLDQDVPAGD